jgi:integrase/recombinase XerC
MSNNLLKKYKEEWIIYLNDVRSLSKHTVKAYKDDFDIYCTFFNAHLGEKFTFEHFKNLSITDIRSFIASRQKDGLNPRSTARLLASIKSFTRYLIKQEIITDHPILNFKMGRMQKRFPKPLTESEAIDLVNQINNLSSEAWIGARNKALMMILYSTGLRISEALSIESKDINRDFIMIKGKGNKFRQVPLIEDVKNSIMDYQRQLPFTKMNSNESKDGIDYLFRGVKGGQMSCGVAQNLLRTYRRTYGLPETATPHSLRHSCATHLLESSSDLRSIQELLGHASLSSTQLYTDIQQNKIRNIFKNAHPRNSKKE